MPSRRPPVHWLPRLALALLLLVTQHMAALHALGHDFERMSQGAPAHSVHACCIAYHGVDDTPAVPVGPAMAIAAVKTPFASGQPRVVIGRVTLPYRSRAPPSFV
jgi:hypothetical protein